MQNEVIPLFVVFLAIDFFYIKISCASKKKVMQEGGGTNMSSILSEEEFDEIQDQ